MILIRILVVEDEVKLADLIASKLKKENYSVDISNDGEDGLFRILDNIYDLIILDVMLPKKDGFQILKELRENEIKSKVIMLTARGTLNDKLEGFDLGADDYLTKPFHMEELIARINVKLRKSSGVSNNSLLAFGDIKLDVKKATLSCDMEEVELVFKELLLLECLIKNSEQVVSREFLYDSVWGMDNDSISNNLEAYISFIRRKLKAIGSSINIRAIRGLGYKLEVSDEEASK